MPENKQWTREDVLDKFVEIIVYTRGVESVWVVEGAKLFGDLHFESIDFLEISACMLEEFGFPYPTDDLGALMRNFDRSYLLPSIDRVLMTARSDLHFRFDIEALDGRNPLDVVKLRQSIIDLITVGYLVDFVMTELVRRDSDASI